MKKYKYAAFVVLIAVALAGATALAKLQGQQPEKTVNERKILVEAMRRGGFREVAKIKGHYVATADPNWDWSSFDLESLTKTSNAVIVGYAGEGHGKLNPTGDVITTEYDLTVKDVLKGKLVNGDTVKVALIGGKVDFDDGTSAEVQTPGFERMAQGKEYVVFLYPNKNGSSVFLVTGGPQGLFEITDSGIKAHARATDAVANQVSNKTVETFLNEIRTLSAKWPQAEECCR